MVHIQNKATSNKCGENIENTNTMIITTKEKKNNIAIDGRVYLETIIEEN